jgi:hypothetical protein
MEKWRYSPTILDFGINWRLLSASRRDRFNQGERVSGTDWIGGILGKKKKSLTSAGIRIQIPRLSSPTIPTALIVIMIITIAIIITITITEKPRRLV